MLRTCMWRVHWKTRFDGQRGVGRGGFWSHKMHERISLLYESLGEWHDACGYLRYSNEASQMQNMHVIRSVASMV